MSQINKKLFVLLSLIFYFYDYKKFVALYYPLIHYLPVNGVTDTWELHVRYEVLPNALRNS